ncbi:MAG: EAL domain-containing protein, partial [Methylophilaceae bacterium]
MSHTLSTQKPVHEIEITYSEEEIAEKLSFYNLKPSYVYTKLITNHAKLATLQKEIEIDSYLFKLCDSVERWKSKNDASFFTANINQLIFLWINAIDDDGNAKTILNILRCFQLKPGVSFSKSSKFHLFLNDLVIETLQKYHLMTLDYLLNYDEDLQLPNVNQIEPNLEAALDEAKNNQITALLSLHFQTENNNFLLPKLVSINLNKQLAEIIRRNVSDKAQLYFSGDSQFDLLLPAVENETQLELITIKIFAAFEEMVFINQQSILVKPFIGCAYANANETSAHALYQNAKLALEQAIKKQKHHVIYNDTLEQSINNQIALESKVLEAFDSNNLALYCQPIVDIKKDECIGAELLLRWSGKYGRNIDPSFMIEILNNVGKGKLFTRWLINTTCRYLHELSNKHKLDIYLTINLRTEDLYDIELPSLFANSLSLWKLDVKNIILEITENGILEQNDNTVTVINALSEMG